jgi:hypothetical protein
LKRENKLMSRKIKLTRNMGEEILNLNSRSNNIA